MRTGRRRAAALFLALAAAACASVPQRQVPEADRLESDHVAAYREAADLRANGRLDEALERIEPYATVSPWHVPTQVLRQDLLVALRGRDAARAWYDRAATESADPAERALRELLAARLLAPDDPRRDAAYASVAARVPGSVWAQLAVTDAALRRAELLEARAVAASDAGRSADAASLRNDATASIDAALASASAAVAIAPGLAAAHGARSDALLAKRERTPGADIEVAADAARRAVELDPAEPRNLVRLARALRRTGDDEGAAKALEDALAIAPGDTVALARLGRVRLDLHDPRAAASLLERAVELNPGDAEAWHDLGVARYRNRDAQGAVDAFERAVAADGVRGGDPRTLEALALTLAAQGRREAAADAMERYVAAGGADRDGARVFIAEMRGAPKAPTSAP